MRIHNIKIHQMAERIGVSTSTMHNIFNGRDPRLTVAMAIQEVTEGQVTCEDLLATVKIGEAAE